MDVKAHGTSQTFILAFRFALIVFSFFSTAARDPLVVFVVPLKGFQRDL